MISSCKTTASLAKDLDLNLVPQKVSVQDITFSFDIDGEIIKLADTFIESFLRQYLESISNYISAQHNIILDEAEFLSICKEYQLSTIFKPSDHYMRKWYSWTSKKMDDLRVKITIYDSLEDVNVSVDIYKGGSREYPEYLISLPVKLNFIEE
jgi:hypothetical protein